MPTGSCVTSGNSPIFAFRSLLIYRFMVGRVIPDSKKEPRVNRGLLRNCTSACRSSQILTMK